MFVFIGKSQSPPDIIRSYIDKDCRINNLAPSDYSDIVVTHHHESSVSKIKHYYCNQRYSGILVHQSLISAHIEQNDTLVAINNQLFRNIEKRISPSTIKISPQQAINLVIDHFKYTGQVNSGPIEISSGSEQKQIFRDKNVSLEDIPVKLMYQQTEDGFLRLSWDLNVLPPNGKAWWSVRVDVETGEILDSINWMVQCFHPSSQHLHSASCQSTSQSDHTNINKYVGFNKFFTPLDGSSYNVFPLGLESPIQGERTLVVNPADLNASPYGWHDTNGLPGPEYTYSRGNNVLTQEDKDANNGTAGQRVEGGNNLVFDFPLHFGLHPHQNQDAGLSNLFYWNNIIHDVIYQYGFTEAAGNFQQNNYGKGGNQNDYVLADAMDGSGTNNANFSTPPDGSNPRMQMYLWSAATSTLTCTIDEPNNIQGNYSAAKASFGPLIYNISHQVVLANDGSNNSSLGCNALVNANEIQGKIALIDRGTCEFGTKCLNAQNAGAIAVIICNNVSGASFAMTPGANGNQVTIPSVMVAKTTCDSIKIYLQNNLVSLIGLGGVPFDSDFDNGVIVHEYAHGISNRLTGGGANTSCLSNQEQMGEGWSDWYGLMLTMKQGDLPESGRGIGTYVLGQLPTGAGIRPYKYSTSLTINPHTYASITTVSVPHGVGSVWCALLWEMTWALIEKYGFDPNVYYGIGGNNIAMTLVTEGLKLQPCFPGFIDGRDAILLADQLMYNGAHQCLIWNAFAKRGLGYSADQGSSFSRSDGIQAFDLPPNCHLSITKTADQNYVSPSDTITYSFQLVNNHHTSIQNIRLIDTLSSNTDYVDGSATDGGFFVNNMVEFPAFDITPGDTIFRYFKVKVPMNVSTASYSFTDGVEVTNQRWKTFSTKPSQSNWTKDNVNPKTGNFCWFAPNISSEAHVYLTLDTSILVGQNAQLQFWHQFNIESNWDGGLVQISKDGGIIWTDARSLMTENGYNGYINNNPESLAFSGNSNGYIHTSVNLSSYKDQMIQIRFVLYNGVSGSNVGWNIDDISFVLVEPLVHNSVRLVTPDINVERKISKPVSIVPCQSVFTVADFGKGSLRKAIDCAVNNDSISFMPSVTYDPILLQQPIILNKNLFLWHDQPSEIIIDMINDESPIFEILSDIQVTINNLSLRTNASSGSKAIINNGTLHIGHLDIEDQHVNPSGNTIQNNGVLNVLDTLIIRKNN